ncbi:MAG: TlpA disulfide reductase family protein [Planctomycetota bacterium]
MKKFVETHCVKTLDAATAGLIVQAASEQSFLSQLPMTYASLVLDQGKAKEFLAGVETLEKAGLKGSVAEQLDGPRAIALFASGQEDRALAFVTKRAAERGEQGLSYIDVHAAILASHGKYEDARGLYDSYAQKFGKKGQGEYRYQSKLDLIGSPAPEIAVSTWLGPGGEKTQGWKGLEDLRDSVVVLDFWQTWCGPCRAVMPSLSKLQAKLKPDEIRVVGLCYKDGNPGFDYATKKVVEKEAIAGDQYVPHVQKFMKDIALKYWVGIADDRTNSEKYKIQGIPTLVVIDPQGTVAWLTIGASPGVDLLIETVAKRLSAGHSG